MYSARIHKSQGSILTKPFPSNNQISFAETPKKLQLAVAESAKIPNPER